MTIQCDVSNYTEAKKLLTPIIEKYGKIDVLVNNAGDIIHRPFNTMEPSQWQM